MSVLRVQNKGEHCSHIGQGWVLAVDLLIHGMMFKTVTLLNAAQTHWRLLCFNSAHWHTSTEVWHRCVCVLAHTRTHTSWVCPSCSSDAEWQHSLCTNWEHIPRQLPRLWSSPLARHVLQVTFCCWGWAEAYSGWQSTTPTGCQNLLSQAQLTTYRHE